MLKLIGIFGILVSCFIFGNSLVKKSETSLAVTESLADFISYIGTSINTLRLPLNEIYLNFKNQTLEDIGFLQELNSNGLSSATNILTTIISDEALNSLKYIEEHLGGIDIKCQYNLCETVEKKLRQELESIKLNYNNKKRMYQLLPLLCGLSLIILIL